MPYKDAELGGQSSPLNKTFLKLLCIQRDLIAENLVAERHLKHLLVLLMPVYN